MRPVRAVSSGVRGSGNASWRDEVRNDASEMSTASSPNRTLRLGCGRDTQPGCVNVDIVPLPNVDVVHDLNELPWPFEDAAFGHVECIDILEHVEDVTAAMREIHRVLVPGGTLRVEGPHFTSYTWPTDPTHRRAFAINTFEFYTKSSFMGRDYYFDFAFREVVRRHIRFQRVIYQPWNWIVEAIVNAHRRVQSYYEATFLARLFPAHKIEVVLSK